MTDCVMCGKAVESSASTGAVCRSCYDSEHAASDASRGSWLDKVPFPLVVALSPFIMTYRVSNEATETVNGITSASGSSIDYIAIVLGPLAMLLGLVALARSRSKPEGERVKAMALSALAVAIGAYQLYRGMH